MPLKIEQYIYIKMMI